MNTLEALLTRRSCRSYTDEPVSREDLSTIVKAGSYAASGMGKQSPKIVVVTDPDLRNELSRMNAAVMGRVANDPFYGAPVVIVVLADKAVPTYQYDGPLVMGNMMLAAHELGLGTCWIHRAKQMFESEEGQEILKKLGIQGEWEGIGNLIVGHAAGELPEAKDRKEDYIVWA